MIERRSYRSFKRRIFYSFVSVYERSNETQAECRIYSTLITHHDILIAYKLAILLLSQQNSVRNHAGDVNVGIISMYYFFYRS